MTILTKQQKPLSTMEIFENNIFDICEQQKIELAEKSKILQERAENLKYMLYGNVVAMPLNTIAKKQGEMADVIDIIDIKEFLR